MKLAKIFHGEKYPPSDKTHAASQDRVDILYLMIKLPLPRMQSGEHPAVQDLLFARISSNYVALLCDPIEERWRGAFFKVNSQRYYNIIVHLDPRMFWKLSVLCMCIGI